MKHGGKTIRPLQAESVSAISIQTNAQFQGISYNFWVIWFFLNK